MQSLRWSKDVGGILEMVRIYLFDKINGFLANLVFSLHPPIGCEDKVSTLLNLGAQGWDLQQVYSFFPPDQHTRYINSLYYHLTNQTL